MKRGLGSPNYDPQRARDVRRLGNAAMTAAGHKHTFTPGTEASTAGRRGAAVTAEKKRQRRLLDPWTTPCQHTGRAGGLASAAARAARVSQPAAKKRAQDRWWTTQSILDQLGQDGVRRRPATRVTLAAHDIRHLVYLPPTGHIARSLLGDRIIR